MTTLVGIAGGSGSGKTTLARQLIERVGQGVVALLAQDAYYRELPSHDPDAIEAHNFDHPDALELDVLAHHLAELKAGRAAETPIYDFSTHKRTAATRRVEPGPVVIVEGILLFALPELCRQFDLRVFVDTPADVRLSRRMRRDVVERGRSWEDVLRQWEATVRPMHDVFVEPSKRHAHLIVPGGSNGAVLDVLAARLAGV